jgi:hypothetical protein
MAIILIKPEIMSIKSYALCPVSDNLVDEKVARINGFFTILLLITYGLTKNITPVVILALDFFLRGSDFSNYSLIGISSKGIARYFRLNKKAINAGPKIFAARIGFVLSSLIILTFFLNAFLPGLAVAGILGLFSFLEAFFGICVACEIYPFLYGFYYKAKFK